MDEHDREQLLKFIASTEDDVQLALEHLPHHHPYQNREIAELARRAWADLQERREFERLGEAVSSQDFDEQLDAVGLTGIQLQFKLAVIDYRRDRVFAARESSALSRNKPRFRRLIAKLLGAIDTVLESLIGALQGTGEIIKEFKQTLEKRLQD